MAEKATTGVLLQMVQQNHEQAEDGHKRHRRHLEGHEGRIENLETIVQTLTTRIGDIRLETSALKQETERIDVGKIVGNWKVVMVVAGIIASNLISNWVGNASVKGEIATLRNEMAVMRVQEDSRTSLQAEQTRATKEAVDTLTRQMEMRRLEIQQVSNDLQQLRRGK